jgi:hypothetical protein
MHVGPVLALGYDCHIPILGYPRPKTLNECPDTAVPLRRRKCTVRYAVIVTSPREGFPENGPVTGPSRAVLNEKMGNINPPFP